MNAADLYQPILAARTGASPLVIRVVTQPSNQNMVGGVPASSQKVEAYVLLSALPDDLKRRVELAVQMILAGG